MKNYKKKVLELVEKIENEVKKEYKTIQENYQGYRKLMEKAQKSTGDRKLETSKPTPLKPQKQKNVPPPPTRSLIGLRDYSGRSGSAGCSS